MIVALRAPSLAKFGEVDTVPVSENSFNIAKVFEDLSLVWTVFVDLVWPCEINESTGTDLLQGI